MAEPLGVLLISGGFGRAHYAFVVATAAASLGRDVMVFATNEGCHALCRDWSHLAGALEDDSLGARGVADFATLRQAADELGIKLVACDAGLRMSSIPPKALLPSVQVGGVAALLDHVGTGQIVTL